MHFHEMSLCLKCGARRAYSTPIPNILILAEVCEQCGVPDLIGTFKFEVCFDCVRTWVRDIEEHDIVVGSVAGRAIRRMLKTR